jgi:hypothetical protein
MKKILYLVVLFTSGAFAHDHVYIGCEWSDSSKLTFDGPSVQYAPYLPKGEKFDPQYAPNWPGGYFVTELTFTTQIDISTINQIPDSAFILGASPQVELISVSGPMGGTISFWNFGASTPTWSRSTGWISPDRSDRPCFAIPTYGQHEHGRAFAADQPGDYQLIFQITDQNNILNPCTRPYVLTIRAVTPPPLSIRMTNGVAIISFKNRTPGYPADTGAYYDIQTKADLRGEDWTILERRPNRDLYHEDESSQTIELAIPITDPKAFFRIVEHFY